jgi:hypothetical protein
MAYGIKVSKEGHDVKVASNDELLLNSQQECLKVSSRNIDSISVPSLTGSIDYQYARYYKDYYHGLGFAPAVRLFENRSDENQIIEAPSSYQERFSPSGPFVGYGYYLSSQSDVSKVRVEVQIYWVEADVSAFNLNYILYIFANSIE